MTRKLLVRVVMLTMLVTVNTFIIVPAQARSTEVRPANLSKNPTPPRSHDRTCRLDVVVRGYDNNVWLRTYQRGWLGWTNLGAPPQGATSDPSVISWENGYYIFVFVRGSDNALWYKSSTEHGVWSGWASLSGTLHGSPDAASGWNIALQVVVRGPGNDIYYKEYVVNVGWAAWKSIGQPPTGAGGDPSVVTTQGGDMEVYVRGGNGSLWHRNYYYESRIWSSWYDTGIQIVGSPDATKDWQTTMIARGTDNQLRMNTIPNNNGTGWSILAGPPGGATSDPPVADWNMGQLDVFVRGSNGALWHSWKSGSSSWSTWEDFGGGLNGSPDSAGWTCV